MIPVEEGHLQPVGLVEEEYHDHQCNCCGDIVKVDEV